VAVRVPLAAGEHLVILDNFGDDWLELDYLEVGHLLAPARVLTLRDSTVGVALAWLQHRNYTWEAVTAEVERAPISFQYRLDEMPAGRYGVEIWDPLSGAVLGEEVVRVGDDGVLLVNLLPMDSELAIRAFRQVGTPTAMDTDVPIAIEIAAPTDTPLLETATTPESTEPMQTPLVARTNTPRPTEIDDSPEV
jgi:hypothetical protein